MISADTVLKEFRRGLIVGHPTFQCPITKQVLDVEESHIIQYRLPGFNDFRIDIVSYAGWSRIPSQIKAKFNMSVVNSAGDINVAQ